MSLSTFVSLSGFLVATLAAFWLTAFASQRKEGLSTAAARRSSTLWVGILFAFSAVDYLSVAEYF